MFCFCQSGHYPAAGWTISLGYWRESRTLPALIVTARCSSLYQQELIQQHVDYIIGLLKRIMNTPCPDCDSQELIQQHVDYIIGLLKRITNTPCPDCDSQELIQQHVDYIIGLLKRITNSPCPDCDSQELIQQHVDSSSVHHLLTIPLRPNCDVIHFITFYMTHIQRMKLVPRSMLLWPLPPFK